MPNSADTSSEDLLATAKVRRRGQRRIRVTARIWDVASRRQLATLKGHKRVVRAVAFSPDGGRLASASYDGTIRLWEAASRRLLALFRGHDDMVYATAFSPDGRTLASASADKTVKLWEAAR